jgi:hypothetical protein
MDVTPRRYRSAQTRAGRIATCLNHSPTLGGGSPLTPTAIVPRNVAQVCADSAPI